MSYNLFPIAFMDAPKVLNASVTNIPGSQAITIQWSTSAGTVTCGPRVMNILRIL